MTDWTRALYGTACVLITAALLAGCGGGEDGESSSAKTSEPPKAPRLEGVFAGTLTTVESTVPNETDIGVESKITLVFLCANDDCTRVYQRSSHEIHRRGSGTWLFDRVGDELNSKAVTTGPCSGKEGAYRQELAWTWRVAPDAATGELRQVFTGCGLDSTSRTTMTMDPKPTGEPIPYLSSADAKPLADALTAYDKAFTPINTDYQSCSDKLNAADQATIIEGAKCLEQHVTTWSAGVRALGTTLAAGPPSAASRACGDAWRKVPAADTLAGPLESARDELRRVLAEGGSINKATDELLPAALKVNEGFQTAVVTVGFACISPRDNAMLGDNGKLVIDVNRALVPGTSNG